MTQDIDTRLQSIEQQLKFFREAYIQMHNEIVKGTHIRINETPFRHAFADAKAIIDELKVTAKELRNESIIGTMAFMAKQIYEMQQAISEIKEKGLKKQIHLDFTLDGYEMVKRKSEVIGTQDVQETKAIDDLLATLMEKESLVLIHRFGLLGNSAKTLERTGIIIDTQAERVRQIQSKALRKCRHLTRRHLVEKLTHKDLRVAILGE